MQLPDDYAILKYYMEQAIRIKLSEETGTLEELYLVRMKINLFHEFQMKEFEFKPGKLVASD